jgi:hypothetical protein
MSAGISSPGTAHLRCAVAIVLMLAVEAFGSDPPTADSHAQPACTRIRVEISDRGVIVAAYEVAEPEYVSRMHRQIDANSAYGSWTVATGDLGYFVTYACLA